MNIKKSGLSIILLLLLSLNLSSQEDINTNTGLEEPKSIESTIELPEEEELSADKRNVDEKNTYNPEDEDEESNDIAEEENGDVDLLEKTLPLDISVSSYYDLLSWCRRLGIEETGAREALQRRLYNYYSVSPPESEDDKEEENLLELKEADELDYSTVDERTNITFTGDVELVFSEESGSIHKITADTLDFNQDEQIITAYGNVCYEITKKGEEAPEYFRGNSLTFDIESWAGLFFQGMSERETSVVDEENKEAIKFYYYGDVIYRSSGDTVILNDGAITTCDQEDPHLVIKAKKIWVLSPGEWAIFNGFFYVGRVPMLYIPGFLKNGDPLFFNPTVGFISDSGYTFQTTTYLIGEKEKKEEDSIIDFMQVGGEESFEREIDGLFLRKSDGLTPFQRSVREYGESSESNLKLMVDYYTYMGVFAGLEGSLKKLGPVSKMDLYLGIAKSREVFDIGDYYTPLYKDDDGEYRSNWENGYFLNYEIPVRFAFDVNMSMSIKKFSMGLDLPVYSDPYFLVDFNNRKEDIEFDEFADFNSEDEDERRSSTDELLSSETWELKTSFKPSTGILSPYLSTASLNKMNFSMSWSTKSMSTDLVESSIGSFFFPSSVTYLDFSLNLSGKVSALSSGENGDEEKPENMPEGLVSPWEDNTDNNEDISDSSEENSDVKEGAVIQDYFSDTKTDTVNDIKWFSNSLSWYIKPDGSFYGKFDEEEWDAPENIDYATEYQVFRSSVRGNLVYSLDLMDSLISVKNTVDGTSKYNNYFYRGDNLDDDEWQDLEDQADALNNVKITNSFNLTMLPFQYNDYFSKTSLKYNVKTNMFLWDWSSDEDDYTTTAFEWDEDSVQTNSMSLDLKGIFFNETQTLNLNIELPPDEMKYDSTLNMKTGPLTSILSAGLQEETDSEGEKTWEKEPVTLNETLKLNEYFSMSEKLSYVWEDEYWGTSTTNATLSLLDGDLIFTGKLTSDLEEMYPESADLSLNLFGFSAKYGLKRQYPYNFSLDEGWQVEEGAGEEFLPDSISFSYNREVLNRKFWKNRINISGKLNTSWRMDLIQFTDSNFVFDITLNCTIHEFMTFSLTSSSKNNATFRYFPDMAETAGVDPINPFIDLFKSFNYFNTDDRTESNFNLNSLKLSLKHDLHDWDLVLELEGAPEVNESGDYNVYEWVSTFSIYVNWKAWSDLEAKVDIDDNEFVF